ncbi:hypothetical protein CF319_g1459 [Tilletia indica]|uniref:Uncharacterized protein n=1 Tax=Tilletia indica TaxID=43049 RepID=A0A177TYR4_9BASI|nr:hypothetical protein CF319_g1459 [Tilletia indica]KAE8234808.1 hypothetical protein CF326_g156 [Tilletia indica]KAE8246660.1 hypothetical protein A4X13_0g5684 [Tilletia indica]
MRFNITAFFLAFLLVYTTPVSAEDYPQRASSSQPKRSLAQQPTVLLLRDAPHFDKGRGHFILNSRSTTMEKARLINGVMLFSGAIGGYGAVAAMYQKIYGRDLPDQSLEPGSLAVIEQRKAAEWVAPALAASAGTLGFATSVITYAKLKGFLLQSPHHRSLALLPHGDVHQLQGRGRITKQGIAEALETSAGLFATFGGALAISNAIHMKNPFVQQPPH